jgi:hypothetical protein
MDILWLQRDFGIYVVNMFDTGQACRVLEMQQFGLAFLLSSICGIQVDKKYQTADWRMRPLSAEMLLYARQVRKGYVDAFARAPPKCHSFREFVHILTVGDMLTPLQSLPLYLIIISSLSILFAGHTLPPLRLRQAPKHGHQSVSAPTQRDLHTLVVYVEPLCFDVNRLPGERRKNSSVG